MLRLLQQMGAICIYNWARVEVMGGGGSDKANNGSGDVPWPLQCPHLADKRSVVFHPPSLRGSTATNIHNNAQATVLVPRIKIDRSFGDGDKLGNEQYEHQMSTEIGYKLLQTKTIR